jgi:hypothetical protein
MTHTSRVSSKSGWASRTGRVIGRCTIGAVLLLLAGWGVLALWFAKLPLFVRVTTASVYGLGMLLLPLLLRPRRRGLLAALVLFALVVVWFLSIPPSNSRNWQPDVAVLPSAEIKGNLVTVHNIRNCDYRSETDYTCHYYDKSFDLNKLGTVDLFLVHWGSPYIAHPILSFGFEGDGYLCFSIETRKEKGEEYSAVRGFFRQYELTYVVADERDVVRLRTNYRKEDVHLYRLKVKPDMIRNVFLDYLAEVNRLHDRPKWYNALTTNCTTSIRGHTVPHNPDAKFDWRIIVNGTLDEMLYERGVVDRSLPFVELKRRSYINTVAQAADRDADFSRRIREGLPLMTGKEMP